MPGSTIRKCVIPSTKVCHTAMSFSVTQQRPEFQFSCVRLMKTSTPFYQVSSTLSSLQRNTLLVEFKVHSTKHGQILPSPINLYPIQKTDQWNGLFIIPQRPAGSFLLCNHSTFQAQTNVPPSPPLAKSFHISSHIGSSRAL